MSEHGKASGFPGLEAGGFSTNDAVLGWLQEIAPYGIFTTDDELRIRSWNQWLVGQSGLSEAAVKGRPLSEVFPGLRERRLLEPFVRAVGGEVSMLSTALHKYLLPFPLRERESEAGFMLQTVRIAPLRTNEAVVGTITIIEDVTQREQQAMILQRQQELDRLLSAVLAALLQSTAPERAVEEIFPTITPSLGLDAYLGYLVSGDGRHLRLNAAGGLSPKQREAISLIAIDAADDLSAPVGTVPLRRTLAAHERDLVALGWRAHGSFPLTVGERVVGLVSFGSYLRTVIPPGDLAVLARIASYVAIALDRSLREREIVAASRAKDDFLAALSHELRTPLNPVLLIASESAANPDYPAEAREAFLTVEKNALLEARLIDDLLDLTRIEHGKIGLEMQPIELHATLRDTIATVQPDAEKRRLKLHVALAASQSVVMGDPGRLQQVFWNVLKNAVKFTPADGEIWIKSEVDEGRNEIVITITDTGIGMESHEVERVFSAFTQGDHAEQGRSHRFGGLGLGLAISRKLVDLHSGRIEARSEGRDRGSTFQVRLPLHRVGVRMTAGASGDESARESLAATMGSRKSGQILLVEDHEPTRLPLTRLLERRGFKVVAVATAAAALQVAEQTHFEIVLSDIGLPDTNGYELMRKLRETYGLRGIALTGYGMTEDVARSWEAGYIAHLTKPVSVSMLDRALAMALPAAVSE